MADNIGEKIVEYPCACGCGGMVSSREVFVWGHRPKKTKEKLSKEARSEIAKERWRKYKAEHPGKEPQPCACGCGALANVGKKWLTGHHLRGEAGSK